MTLKSASVISIPPTERVCICKVHLEITLTLTDVDKLNAHSPADVMRWLGIDSSLGLTNAANPAIRFNKTDPSSRFMWDSSRPLFCLPLPGTFTHYNVLATFMPKIHVINWRSLGRHLFRFLAFIKWCQHISISYSFLVRRVTHWIYVLVVSANKPFYVHPCEGHNFLC